MENLEIKSLMYDLKIFKQKYRYYQCKQENDKRDFNIWDPYDGLSREQHEKMYGSQIADNTIILNFYEKKIKEYKKKIKQAKIKEYKKKIKQANRAQNKKRET